MSWALPVSRFELSYVLDRQEFNEQIAAFCSEIDGNLNEHNMTDGLGADLFTAGKVDETFAMRCILNANDVSPLVGTNGQRLPDGVDWSPVDETEAIFGSVGGKILVFISFQLSVPIRGLYGPALQFVIELDGNPMFDTLLGSGDLSNDYYNTDPSIANPPEIVHLSGGGISGDEKHVLHGVFTVGAGQHTVRLLVRTTTGNNLGDVAFATAIYAQSTETIVLHLWA